MASKIPKPGTALARTDAVFRARGIEIIENTSTETTVRFVATKAKAAGEKTGVDDATGKET